MSKKKKFRVFVKVTEYGSFEYEGNKEDLEKNLDSIVEEAEEEGMVHWSERDVMPDGYKEE